MHPSGLFGHNTNMHKPIHIHIVKIKKKMGGNIKFMKTLLNMHDASTEAGINAF